MRGAPTRIDAAGALVPLEEQDRSRWQRDAIAEGARRAGQAALAQRRRGPYQMQAAIAALHAQRRARRGHRLGADRRAVRRPAREQPGAGGRANAAVALAMAAVRSTAWPGSTVSIRAASSPAITCCPPHAPTCCAGSAAAGSGPRLPGGARAGAQPCRAPLPRAPSRRLRRRRRARHPLPGKAPDLRAFTGLQSATLAPE